MKQYTYLATVLLATLNLGFVERRIVITSDPPGALVYRNGVPIGTTPCDDHFVFYGKYKFTLVRDKFATLVVEENIKMPWYEIPGIDFVSENLYPIKVIDVRRLHYKLPPLIPDNPQDLLTQSLQLRERGKLIGNPPVPRPPLPGPPLPQGQGQCPPGAVLPPGSLPPPGPPLIRPPQPVPSQPMPAAPPWGGPVPPMPLPQPVPPQPGVPPLVPQGPPNVPTYLPGGGVPIDQRLRPIDPGAVPPAR